MANKTKGRPAELALQGVFDGVNRLGVGPRYCSPLDRTLILHVYHRTTGGGQTVLLDGGRAAGLAGWLRGDGDVVDGALELVDDLRHRVTTARRFEDGRVQMSIVHTPTSQGRTVVLSPEGATELADWLDRALKDEHQPRPWLPVDETPEWADKPLSPWHLVP